MGFKIRQCLLVVAKLLLALYGKRDQVAVFGLNWVVLSAKEA